MFLFFFVFFVVVVVLFFIIKCNRTHEQVKNEWLI